MAIQTSADNQITVLSASWNNASTAYTAFKLDVNNILTPPSSVLFDIGTNTGTYTSRFLINVSGSVGIGTNNPTARLHISGSATGTTPTLLVRHGVAEGSDLPVLSVQNSAGSSLFVVSGSGDVRSTGAEHRWTASSGNSILHTFYNSSATELGSVGYLFGGSDLSFTNKEAFGNIILKTANTTQMIVRFDGNVGIGTTTAFSERLLVKGSTSDSSAVAIRAENSSGNVIFYARNDGNVGMGTASPLAALDVSKSTGSVDIRLSNGGTAYMNLYGGSGVGALTMLAVQNEPLVLGANNLEKMRIMSSADARVGIGTITPSNLGGYGNLSVNGSAGGSITLMENGNERGQIRGVSGATYIDSVSSQPLVLQAASYDAVIIDTTGNTGKVSINAGYTINAQLHIANDSFSTERDTIRAEHFFSNRTNKLRFTKSNRSHSIGQDTGINFALIDETASAIRLLLSGSDGSIGIGSTTTVAARFQVSGSSTTSTPTMIVREGVVSPTGGALAFEVENSVGTTLFCVSGSGFVGIGTSNNLVGTKVAIYGATAPDTFTGHILLSSDTASSAINNGGQLNFQMYDGSSYRGSGFIKSAKENGTASNYASYMSFGTRVNGDSVLTERMRIDSTGSIGIGTTVPIGRVFITGSTSTSQPAFVVRAGTAVQSGGTKIVDILNSSGTGLFHVSGSGDVTVGVGNLVIGTSGKGIDFSATANAPSGTLGQEILDDYEEGSWTPGTTVGGGGTITSTRSGHYTKIGRVVHVKFFIEASAVSGTRTTLTITGLPFQVDVTYTNAWVECYQLNNTGGLLDDFSHGMVWTNATSNSLTFDIYETTSGTPIASPASFIVANTLITGHITYFTNQ